QTMIVTPTDGLDAGSAQVPVSGGNLPVYFAAPKKAGKYPVVIVIPEIWGMHEHIKDVTRRVGKAGYFGVTLEPYFRIGDLTKIADIKEVVGKANSLRDEDMLADLDALVGWADKQPKANAKKLGITGFCRGGRTVWMYTAHSKRIKAGVSWYGGLNPPPPAPPPPPHDAAPNNNTAALRAGRGGPPGD